MTDLLLPALVIDRARAEPVDRPTLINRDPGPSETGVPRASSIYLQILDPEEDAPPTADVYVDGVLAWDGTVKAGFDGAGSGGATSTGLLAITLVPTTPFASEAVVSVRVVAETDDEAGSLDTTYTFSIEDVTAPSLVAAQARGQKVVRLSFDEAVVVTDGTGFTFEALTAPAVGLAAVSAVSGGSYVDVTVDQEMSPGQTYQVTAVGITDAVGNAIGDADTATFLGFVPIAPSGRRFDLWSMLPRHNRRTDATGDLRRLIDVFQDVVTLLLAEIDRFADLRDLERAPDAFVDLMLVELGNPFVEFDLSATDRRKLLSLLAGMYQQKGTAVGIENAIRVLLGIESTVAPLQAAGSALGTSRIGVDWILGSDAQAVLYSFTVEVEVVLSETERGQIRRLAEFLKPAHTHLAAIIEPTDPDAIDHWSLGLSRLGQSTTLH